MSNPIEIHVGVVGAGYLGEYHIARYLENPAVKSLVICDPDAARRQELRAKYPRVSADYAGLEELLASEKLHAVSIVTPDHLHRAGAEKCLAAGCHALITKPLATNLEDAVAIIRCADRHNRHIFVAQETRFRSRFRAVADLLRSGRLGEIIHLRVDAISDRRIHFAEAPWYRSAETGRSAIVGTGVHEVDLLRHLIGRPVTAVSAMSNRLGSLEFPKDKTIAALFQFEGGAIGQVTVTYEARWPKAGRIDHHIHLVGSKGMVIGNVVSYDGETEWLPLPTDKNEVLAGSQACVDAFLETVLRGVPPAVSGRDALESLEACVAADRATETGRVVAPAEIAVRV